MYKYYVLTLMRCDDYIHVINTQKMILSNFVNPRRFLGCLFNSFPSPPSTLISNSID